MKAIFDKQIIFGKFNVVRIKEVLTESKEYYWVLWGSYKIFLVVI